jgi:hypothetical protein
LNSKFINFDFNFLVKDIIFSHNSIFDIKVLKVPKKYKLKNKSKYLFELSYVYKEKRLRQTLKLINNNVIQNNGLNLKNNFFLTFCDVLLDSRNSFI